MLPLITIMTRQTLIDRWEDEQEQWQLLGRRPMLKIAVFLYDARKALITTILTALSRGLSEVGGVMIVGGNIEHATRVMTTAIALETSKGNLALASSLGFVLLILSLAITMTITSLQKKIA